MREPGGSSARLYTSSFKLPLRWLRLLTSVTYLSKLLGILRLAALMPLE